ncbi:hypothetical protein [Leifsonia xyli]|uniref:hypothetical protein n=1 Tax=Leifsonia xyli TaxID=1575 RepID=UPI003D665BF9
MSPNEAAALLGVSPGAESGEVQRAYELRLEEAGADVQRRDALTAARDALLAASAWQVSQQQPAYPQPQQRAYAPPPPVDGRTPQAYGTPQAYAPPYAPPPPPQRRRLSTGAIVGITLGGIAAGLVLMLMALFSILAIAHSSSRLADAPTSSTAAPFDEPSAPPTDGSSQDGGADDPAADDYDVDGVHVHYVDGWTFELTPGQTCAGATITAGFSDSPEGDEVDQWSTTIDLVAGEPYTFTIPDSASAHDYAGIDAVQCGQA